jgi:hypothetical protein
LGRGVAKESVAEKTTQDCYYPVIHQKAQDRVVYFSLRHRGKLVLKIGFQKGFVEFLLVRSLKNLHATASVWSSEHQGVASINLWSTPISQARATLPVP